MSKRSAPEQFVQLGVEELVVLWGLAAGVVGEGS
jgi:hypothetical protein